MKIVVVLVIVMAVLGVLAVLALFPTNHNVARSFILTYDSNPRWQSGQCMPPAGTGTEVSWNATGATPSFEFVIWPSSGAPLTFHSLVGATFPVSEGGSYNFSALNLSGPASIVSVTLTYSESSPVGLGPIAPPPCYA